MHQAHCRCGGFRFESSSAPILQLVCHCAQCRSVSGLPFTRFVFFKVRDTQTSGAMRAVEFTADSGARTVREVCATCGEMLIDRTDGFPKVVGVVVDRFDPPIDFKPAHHVWAESRAPGTELPADVPVFERGSA